MDLLGTYFAKFKFYFEWTNKSWRETEKATSDVPSMTQFCVSLLTSPRVYFLTDWLKSCRDTRSMRIILLLPLLIACVSYTCDPVLELAILHALYAFSIINQLMGRTCLSSHVLSRTRGCGCFHPLSFSLVFGMPQEGPYLTWTHSLIRNKDISLSLL